MSLKFYNVKSKETRIAETEPQISAMWGSGDRSPNATFGQDFGWRLAPEVVVQMREISADQQKLMSIASRYNLMLQDVDEKVVLQYISDTTNPEDAPVAREEDYTDAYEDEIRRIARQNAKKKADAEKKTA